MKTKKSSKHPLLLTQAEFAVATVLDELRRTAHFRHAFVQLTDSEEGELHDDLVNSLMAEDDE